MQTNKDLIIFYSSSNIEIASKFGKKEEKKLTLKTLEKIEPQKKLFCL